MFQLKKIIDCRAFIDKYRQFAGDFTTRYHFATNPIKRIKVL